ncbi:MAG: hypothetical protein WD823_11925 [Sulfuricaulis sp.]|uniref:hypothetical protein n=1 Tax=Sulfuricaulis sp. TaxID=2003553 RepID=UPI0034A515F0
MEEPELDQDTINQAACDAALLLTEAIRELSIPQHLMTCANKLEETQRVSATYAAAVQRIAMTATVIGVYRVNETRKHFLTPWLFSEEELQRLGLPEIEHFVRDCVAFETVRSQWAAHAQAKKSTIRRPGRLIDASALGRALERTGIGDEEQFLRRIRDELTPAVERVRDKILEAYAEARDFITTGYPRALQQGAIDEERNRDAV